ncbi:MAG: sugar ABC transporter substrate-binding protein [Firmicutes bacterium]|nr:sugar ABC transporter substrate-binding protein [Bacillota bacterium]
MMGLLTVSGVIAAKEYRFVIVPKVVHPWFDLVNDGAKEQARILEEQTGDTIVIDYRAPSKGQVTMQNDILEQAAATRPDGIAVDLLDAAGNKAVLQTIVNMGIPVVIFDSESPEGMNLTKIGNDFAQQAEIASERLVELLGGKGKVAIMQGVPTAPNHRIRYEAHKAVFEKYPGIELVAEGIDNDDIETAQNQAASIIAANPDIDGFVACDAAGPIGIGLAVKEAGKTDDITVVGLDNLNQLIELIREGVVESSSSTKPQMQGAYSILTLWQKAIGQPTPKEIDTGIDVLTLDNLEELGY